MKPDAHKSTAQGVASDYVTMTVGNQRFGIAVEHVQDVFTPQAVTRVPLAPPEVRGVVNLRGRIVTIIDARQRLGLPPGSVSLPSMAVGIERGGESYGLIIDQIGEVMRLEGGSFQRCPENLDPRWRRISKGVYRLEDTLLVVLDVDLLINLEQHERAA